MAENKPKLTIDSLFNDYAKESKDKKGRDGTNLVVDTKTKFNIEFISDFGDKIKKGNIMKGISLVAKDFYVKNGVAKDIK